MLTFKNPVNSSIIETFEIKKARLLNQSISSSVQNMLSVSLNISDI